MDCRVQPGNDGRDLLQADLRQILKPVLRLHEFLHLGRQRVRIGVVHHPHQRGVVDDQSMRLRQQFVLLGDVKILLGLVDQRIDLRVLVAAPVDADRRDLAGVEEADDGATFTEIMLDAPPASTRF